MDRYIISDTHFWHPNVLIFDKRPWESIEEMNEGIIKLWNDTVSKKDIVFHLGDFCWAGPSKAVPILDRLNGTIHLIRGNHDKLNLEMKKRFKSISDLKRIRVGDYRLLLSHRPFRTWEHRGENYFNVHGHVHGNSEDYFGAIDLSCNMWKYEPVPVEVVVKHAIIIAKTTNNPNRGIKRREDG